MPVARIFNATRHQPSREQRVAGVGPACGWTISQSASFEDIRRIGRELAAEAARAGAQSVMIGGLSSLAIATFEAATALRLGVVEAVADTASDDAAIPRFQQRRFRILKPPTRRRRSTRA